MIDTKKANAAHLEATIQAADAAKKLFLDQQMGAELRMIKFAPDTTARDPNMSQTNYLTLLQKQKAERLEIEALKAE